MNLTDAQRAMLDGGHGAAVRQAMQILYAVGLAKQAPCCIPVRSAHVGLSVTTLRDAGVHWLESLADSGAKVRVPTTTNVLSIDREAVDADPQGDAGLQRRALHALARMGAAATCSCNPFSQGYLPAPGESVAWSESATAPFVNGVLGARTNREGATALASALTGITPCYGMHRTAERRATVAFRVTAAVAGLDGFHLLGAVVARRCAGKIPVLVGLPASIEQDDLYGFCAAFATYSPLAMFHMVGVTPEAPTLQAALTGGTAAGQPGGDAAAAPDLHRIQAGAIDIGGRDLEDQRKAVDGLDGQPADVAVIGCPHASLAQLREIALLMHGRAVGRGKIFFVHTNAVVKAEAVRLGLLEKLVQAGVKVTCDTCVYTSLDRLAPDSRLLTNSSKMAFLMSSRGLSTALASTADCVRAMA